MAFVFVKLEDSLAIRDYDALFNLKLGYLDDDGRTKPKAYDKLAQSTYEAAKLQRLPVIWNHYGAENIILFSNSPLCKGYLNEAAYSICGSDADESVKKHCDYVAHFPINTKEFDFEAVAMTHYMFADAVGGDYKQKITDIVLSMLNLHFSSHLLKHSNIKPGISLPNLFEALKEL